MNKEPKSIWKKSWKGRGAFLVWCALIVAAICLAVLIAALGKLDTPLGSGFTTAGFVAILIVACGLFVIFAVIPFLRWLFWKHWRRTLFILACFITMIALFYAEEDWRGWHAWNQFKHEWEAKGEKFDWQSVVPPPVPDDQNFALTPVVASCYEMYFDKNGHEVKPRNTNVVDRLSMLSWRDVSYENQREKVPDSAGWLAAQKMDLRAWQAFFRSPPPTDSALTNSFPIAPRPQTPAEDVLLALSKYDSVIGEIRKASRLPCSRFPLTYNSEDAFSILLPHLGALKTSAQTVRLRSVAELQKNQTEPAVEDVRLGLYLANSIRTETFLISQLVRLSMLEIALQPVWEGLAEHRWSEPQLIALDEELAKLDFLADYEFSWRSELGFLPKVLEYRRHTRDTDFFFSNEYGNHQNYPLNVEFAMFVFRHCPGGWFYQNQTRFCRFVLQYDLPAIDSARQLAFPASAKRADEARLKEVAPLNPYNFIEYRLLFPPYDFLAPGQLAEKFAHAQTSVDLARVAIALERYRLAHGEYPESPDALSPQFTAKIPHDIINGQPLHYRREADPSSQSSDAASGQFVLYSVGWNETDDGGTVGLKKDGAVDINQGDWVWRYPAN